MDGFIKSLFMYFFFFSGGVLILVVVFVGILLIDWFEEYGVKFFVIWCEVDSVMWKRLRCKRLVWMKCLLMCGFK